VAEWDLMGGGSHLSSECSARQHLPQRIEACSGDGLHGANLDLCHRSLLPFCPLARLLTEECRVGSGIRDAEQLDLPQARRGQAGRQRASV